jgi:2-oxoglutarate ferredoxin oxidoreductase subunit gamma
MRKFEDIVKPGGLLIVNSSIVEEKCPRDDIEVVYIPANEIAAKVKNPRGANVAIFGAYVAKKLGVASKENILEAIRISLGEEKARFFEGNVRALEAGIEFTKNLDK